MISLQDFLEGIRPELETLPTPEPTATLRARIIASREAGVRTILPNPVHQRRFPPRVAIGIAIVAGLALLFVPLELRRSPSPSLSPSEGDEGLGSPGVFGHAAFAQGAPVRDGGRPALEPVGLTAPDRLRPMSLEFERRVADGTGAVGVSHIALRLAGVFLDVPAWRVTSVERKAGPTPSVAVETVFVARAPVRLLRRTIHVSPYSRFQRINVWQEFPSSDSASGHMNTEGPSIGPGRSFARKLPPAFAPYITESAFPFFLMAAPLSRNWSGSSALLGWAVRDDDVFVPVELRVEGEEPITIPAGRFDCWRLSLRFAGRRLDYWARKTDRLGVRVLDGGTPNGKGRREIVLTRISQ